MRARLCLLGVLILWNAGLPAQQPTVPATQDVPVFRTSTDLVTIDAVVTDGNGKHVTDLKAEDFEVTVAGKRQTLDQALYIRTQDQPRVLAAARAAAIPSGSSAPSAGTPASRAIAAAGASPDQIARTIAVVVDDLGLSFESMYYVRRAVQKYIDTQIEPGDLVAIIRTAGGIGALQQFTTDKRLLHMAADRLQWDPRSRHTVGAFAPVSPGVPAGMGFDGIDAFRSSLLSVGSMAALEYIARGVSELPGRKCIVYFSEGVPSIFKDRMGIGRDGSGRIWSSMTQMLDRANEAGVVINTVDARGLQTGGTTAEDNPGGRVVRDWDTQGNGRASMMNASDSGGFLDVPGHQMGAAAEASESRGQQIIDSQDSLRFIADQTGGLAVENTNDLNLGMRRVLDDQDGYYLLGYIAPKGSPRTGWDQNRVKVRVKRPGLRVRSRQGFFGPFEGSRAGKPESADPLVMSAISPFGAGAITVRLTSVFGNDEAAGPYVRSLVFVDPANLHFGTDGIGQHTARFQVLLMAIGDNGQVLDGRRREVSLALTDQNFRRAQEHGIVVALRTGAKEPGPYQMRASVADLTSGKIGSASQFLEVPAVGRGKLALSGVLLKGVADGDPAQPESPDGQQGLVEGVLFEPEIRILPPGTKAVYAYEIYDGLGDANPDLQMAAALIRDGKVVYQGPFTPVTASPKIGRDKMRTIAIGGTLTLASDMAAGPCTLEVVVRGPDRKKLERKQWLDFEIRP